MAKNNAYVCFCVDGPSDIDALKISFSDLFDSIGGSNIEVDFRHADFQGENHGDITSLENVDPSNIEKMIHKHYFKQQDRKSDLGWEDLTYLIHIIDLDGAYVDDIREFTEDEMEMANKLITRGKPKKTLYMNDHIAVRPDNVKAVANMLDRNKRKRKNIEHLLEIDGLTFGRKTVKYALYYFSSNLDHFLYGDANLTGAAKMIQASKFSAHVSNSKSLVEFFENSPFSSQRDYYQSWKALRKGNASLSMGTNVNLLIDKIKASSLEDWL